MRGAVRSFGTRAAIIRPFSLYGEGLRKQLIWDICQKLRTRPDRLLLGGSGAELRDFVHVGDAAAFFVGVLERLWRQPDELITVNCGSGRARTIREVAEAVGRAWSLPFTPTFSGGERAGDPVHLVADATGARQLGFRDALAFDEGLRRYVAWFHRHYPSP